MSTYAAISDLEKKLEGFYDELYYSKELDAVDSTQAQQDLDNAEAEINASAAVRYSVPVTAAKSLQLLKYWTLALAEEAAWGRGSADKVPEKVEKRAANVRKLLERLTEGKVALDGAGEKEASAGGASEITMATPEFTRTKMEGW
jgi:phage gp36-like protein